MKILSDYQSNNGVVISALVKFRHMVQIQPTWTASDVSFNNEVFDNNIDETKYETFIDASEDYYVHIGQEDMIFNINPQYREDDTYKSTFNEIFDQIFKIFDYSVPFSNPQCVVYKITNTEANTILDKNYNSVYGRMCLYDKNEKHNLAWIYSNKNGGYAIEGIYPKTIREYWLFDKCISKIIDGRLIIPHKNY